MLLFEETRLIELKNAQLVFIQSFYEKEAADQLLKELIQTIAWEQGEITIYGKKVLEPRLTAWYGDAETDYTYSGKTQTSTPWTPTLLAVKNKIEQLTFDDAIKNSITRNHYNAVLLNYYRNGLDSMGFHSDNEKKMGVNPTIASLNLGESRRFIFRRRDNKNDKFEILLTHGSLLIMAGEMQHYWQHAVPKEPKKRIPVSI